MFRTFVKKYMYKMYETFVHFYTCILYKMYKNILNVTCILSIYYTCITKYVCIRMFTEMWYIFQLKDSPLLLITFFHIWKKFHL